MFYSTFSFKYWRVIVCSTYKYSTPPILRAPILRDPPNYAEIWPEFSHPKIFRGPPENGNRGNLTLNSIIFVLKQHSAAQ